VIAAGVGVALAAAVANAFAAVLQASEARRSPSSEAMHASLLQQLAHRPRWLAGAGLEALAWPLQLIALGLAPIAVVQPALGTGQLVLLGIARFSLKERIGPHEVISALAIVFGLVLVVEVAPGHTVVQAGAGQLAAPMALVGGAAVIAYLVGRAHSGARIALVGGAGLAYAWADFDGKLLTNDASSAHYGLAAIWLACIFAFGAVAFLEETSALQHHPAVTVAPVISAIKVPLPVLMALWAGIEHLRPGDLNVVALLCGLALVAAGGAGLARSKVVARVSERPQPVETGHEHPQPANTGDQHPRPANTGDQHPQPANTGGSPHSRARSPRR
jgi:hypothetical protein